MGVSDALGYFNQSLIEQYSGSGWSVVPSPDPGLANDLDGVGCSSPSECWAVGTNYPTSPDTPESLIEEFQGSGWVAVSSPDPSTDDDLWNVACDGLVNCWAVGYSGFEL